MRGRFVAVTMVLAMLVICILPFCSDNSDAESDTLEYKITIPDYSGPDETNNIKMKNGESRTVVIYLKNECDHTMNVSLYTMSTNPDISSERITNLTVYPHGGKDDLLKQDYVIKAEDVMPSCHEVILLLIIRVMDVSGDAPTRITTVKFLITVESEYDVSGTDNKFLGVFDNNLPAPLDGPWTPFIVTLLVYMAVALVIMKVIIVILTRFMRENSSDHERKVMRMTVRSAVFFSAAALFADLGIRILGTKIKTYHSVHLIVLTVLVVMAAILIWQIYSVIIDYLLWKMGKEEESFIDPTLLPIFAVVGKLILWVGGIAIILHLYGMELSGILLSAGIVTLGISLGAQSVLSQFFSGIVLLLTRPFNRGEYVEMNNHTYIVKRVKLMYTEFYGVERDRVITMPNNAVVSSTIINMSKYDKAYRMYIEFDIPSNLDVKKVEELLLQLADENEHVMHDETKYRKPRVKFMDFKGPSVHLRLDATIRNFEDLPEIQSEMKRGLFVKLAEAGMEASYSKLKVTVENPEGGQQEEFGEPKGEPSV